MHRARAAVALLVAVAVALTVAGRKRPLRRNARRRAEQGPLRLAQFIQAEEQAVGIDVVIDSTDSASAQARAQTGNFDAYLASFFTGSNDPNGNITMFLSTASVRNLGGYSNNRLDHVLTNALKATQIAPRAVNYRVAQQIIHNDRPIIYLYNQLTIAGYSTSITGLQLSGGGMLIPDYAEYK